MLLKHLGNADQLRSNLPEEENLDNEEDDANLIKNLSDEKEGEF